ncbi:hypothetical protein ABW19_dt0202119 [Dactylella cylindrospora]|nr:hypothetical protein ABW19_dt0202119 [Dactylella cylindrospora]
MLSKSTLFAVFPLLQLTTAHFLLNYPPSIGFSDDEESSYPCGGFDVASRNTVTEFPIGGIPISVKSTHPAATWFFRAALLNDTENWVALGDAVYQVGQGDYCQTSVPGPAGWEDKDGVLQVVQTATDGYLFQCAAVKFTAGEAGAVPSTCTNATNVEAEYVDAEIVLNASVTSTVVAPPESTETGSSGGHEHGDDDHEEGHNATTTTTSSTATGTDTAASNTSTPNGAVRYGDVGLAVFAGVLGVAGLLL